MTEAVLSTLFEASLRTGAVAALVAVLLIALRVKSSQAQHAAWSSVVAAFDTTGRFGHAG